MATHVHVMCVCVQVDWETMWRERLADFARPQEVKSALGWSTKVTVEVGQGSNLLQLSLTTTPAVCCTCLR